MSSRLVKKFFNDTYVLSSGSEVGYILTRDYNKINGYIKQISFSMNSGVATQLSNIEIRYFSGDSNFTNLVYKYTNGTISSSRFVDSNINAPFNLNSVDSEDGLILYVQSDANATFDIRVDLEILGS